MKYNPSFDLKINLLDLKFQSLRLENVDLIHRLIIFKCNLRFFLHHNFIDSFFI